MKRGVLVSSPPLSCVDGLLATHQVAEHGHVYQRGDLFPDALDVSLRVAKPALDHRPADVQQGMTSQLQVGNLQHPAVFSSRGLAVVSKAMGGCVSSIGMNERQVTDGPLRV